MSTFFSTLVQNRKDSPALVSCMEDCVSKLMREDELARPRLLFGSIQGGKTRAFIGIIAKALDEGFDICFVFTKNSTALTEQTLRRIKRDFMPFIEQSNPELYITDVMYMSNNYTKYQLRKKYIFICKKEKRNLMRVIKFLKKHNDIITNKRILFVDDEADTASVNFRINEDDDIVLRTIHRSINEAQLLCNNVRYLQVTATPYLLYLQPSDLNSELKDTVSDKPIKPLKPAFTTILPDYEGYVGGKQYYRDSEEPKSLTRFLFSPVEEKEIQTLCKKKYSRFKIEESMYSEDVSSLRNAIFEFIVGSVIRILHDEKTNTNPNNYCFIIHVATKKALHRWQYDIVNAIITEIIRYAKNNNPTLKQLLLNAYNTISTSALLAHNSISSYEEVSKRAIELLADEAITLKKFNTDKTNELDDDVTSMLDEKGQLLLSNPMNIFVGGQMLDRGLTIDNLIGFYYGRKSYKYQNDTVLQHSRMYGYRSKLDLSVTKLHTTDNLYEILKQIYEDDESLRESLGLSGENEQHGIVFLNWNPTKTTRPCDPKRTALSKRLIIKPLKRFLPTNFETNSQAAKCDKEIMEMIKALGFTGKTGETAKMIDLKTAIDLVDKAFHAIDDDENKDWFKNNMEVVLKYLSEKIVSSSNKGKVWLLVRTTSSRKKFREDGSFTNNPDDGQDEGAISKQIAEDIPALMLVRILGEKSNGWKNGIPFWWPVIRAQKNSPYAMFAREQQRDLDENEEEEDAEES